MRQVCESLQKLPPDGRAHGVINADIDRTIQPVYEERPDDHSDRRIIRRPRGTLLAKARRDHLEFVGPHLTDVAAAKKAVDNPRDLVGVLTKPGRLVLAVTGPGGTG